MMFKIMQLHFIGNCGITQSTGYALVSCPQALPYHLQITSYVTG